MNWKSEPYRPPIQNPKGKVASSPLAPLARFTGVAGMLLTAFAAAKAAEWMLGLHPGFWNAKWGPRETIVIGAVLVLSLMGGLIGLGLGLQVSVSNPNVARLGCILWHLSANCMIVLVVLLTLLARKEERHFGLEVMPVLEMFFVAMMVAGGLLFFLGQFRENGSRNPFLWSIVCATAAAAAGYLSQGALQLATQEAVIFGAIAGVVAVFVSARTIQRDYEQMRQIQE